MKKQTQFRPAAPDELQIDLDRPRARIPKRLMRLVSEHVKIKSVKYSKSKSGNTHATIKTECSLCRLGFPKIKDREGRNIHYGTQSKGMIPNTQCEIPFKFEILFLQVALGSDPVRELLSWGRARNGCPYPTLFFEEKK